MDRVRAWKIGRRALGKPALLVIALLVLSQTSYFQSHEFMTASQLLNEIRKSHRLNSGDIKKLTPLVDKERHNVLRIYAWFSGDEPEYSHRVWQRMIAQRQDFESSIAPDLTQAQASALRAARTRVESQMLTLLVGEYVIYLDRSLELDISQLDDVAHLFEEENAQLYKAFTRHLSDPSLLLVEIEKIEQRTEDKLRRILNYYQWRDYQILFEADELVAVALRSSHNKER